jgi:hypothetical protein
MLSWKTVLPAEAVDLVPSKSQSRLRLHAAELIDGVMNGDQQPALAGFYEKLGELMSGVSLEPGGGVAFDALG